MVLRARLFLVMFFDFKLFESDVKRIYSGYEQCSLELNEVVLIFKYYFEKFEKVMSVPHPRVNQNALIKILNELPYVYDEKYDFYVELTLNDYIEIIDKHFATRYRFCDYNIIHFFSGRIRLLRFYELENRS